jgi:protein-tyrosine-phosphatase
MRPIRGPLRRRARRAWRSTDAPLILCYGNINRSAFAAGLARSRGRAGARSAGFYPQEGRPSPEATVACSGRYGIDLTDHRSRRVTHRDLVDARAIFVFDLENLARVAKLAPLALVRTHFIGALDDDPPLLIADPYGHGPAVLEDTLARIARAVDHAQEDP